MSTHPIGVIGLPEVASSLEDLDYDVVTGERFVDASKAVREAAEQGPLPILVADRKQLGLPQLLSRLQDSNARVLVIRLGAPFLPESWDSVPSGSTLGEILRAVGEDGEDYLDDFVVSEDGSVIEQESSRPAPTPQPAPEPIPDPEPAPAAAAQDDPFGDDEPAPAPRRRQAAAEDPFASDEPAPAPRRRQAAAEDPFASDEPAPAPRRRRPAPAEDIEDDPFADEDKPAPAPRRRQAAAEDPFADADVEPAPSPRRRRPEPVEDIEDDPAPVLIPESDLEDDEPAPRSRQDRASEEDTNDDDGNPVGFSPAPAPRRRRVVAPIGGGDPDARDAVSSAFGGYVEADETLPPEPDRELDADDVISMSRSTRRSTREKLTVGALLVSFAGKGGVGKSTLTMCLAQHAAEVAGLRVCVIDANRGQGDIGLYLKLRKSNLPTIYEAIQIDDLDRAFISPEDAERVRGPHSEQLLFSVVQAPKPTRDTASPHSVDAKSILRIIRLARKKFDLVVVDTQITEGGGDTTGIIDDAIIPALREGGFALGSGEPSVPGIENLQTAIRYLREGGVPADRILSMVNKFNPRIRSTESFEALLSKNSKWVGAVYMDPTIAEEMNSANIPHDLPSLAPLLDAVLLRAVGGEEFRPKEITSSATSQKPAPWWKKLLGK